MRRKTKTIGERIKLIREINNLSIPQLSELINIAPTTIRRWESDEVLTKADSLVGFVCKLSVNANWLITGEGSMKNTDTVDMPEELQWLLDNCDNLSDDNWKHLIQTIQLYKKS